MSSRGKEAYEVKEVVRGMLIDRKRGQNVWRDAWIGAKLMECRNMRGDSEKNRRRCNMARE